ncbi:MAG TPA: hypothetical protein VHN11_23265, partial [Xanthobacteraceae bacterium]|nr:hypothetical protein [Xanthobacteraceae bacterium]
MSIGLKLAELSGEERRRLIALDQSRGGNSLLVDLAEECGISCVPLEDATRKWHTAVTCPCCGAHPRYEVS